MHLKFITVLSLLVVFISCSKEPAIMKVPKMDDQPESLVFSQITDWSFKTNGEIYGNAAVSEDKIFIGNNEGSFFCLDMNGAEVWSLATGFPIKSEPVFSNSLVMFSAANRLFALNSSDGSLFWMHEPDETKRNSYVNRFDDWDLKDSSPIVSDGVVYYGNQFGTLYGLDIRTGVEVFNFKTTDNRRIRVKPAISENLIYIGDSGGKVYAIDLSTAKADWIFETLLNAEDDGGSIIGEMVIIRNRLYFPSQNTILYALDKNNAEVLWEHESTSGWHSGIPVVDENLRLYAGENFTSRLFGLDELSGEESWTFEGIHEIYNAPVIVGDKIVLATSDPSSLNNNSLGTGILHVLRNTGEGLKRATINGSVYASPKIAGNKLIFGAKDGFVYAVNLEKLLAE